MTTSVRYERLDEDDDADERMYVTVKLNRFHRLAMWCRDCDTYWQLPNHLVMLHGRYERQLIVRMLRINLYLYSRLLDLDMEQCFGLCYDFDTELRSVLYEIQQKLHEHPPPSIKILDVDVVASLQENMPAIADFISQIRSTFDVVAVRLRENSPRSFLGKLGVLRKNITQALETQNVKSAIDNLMDLNIAGFDILVQCVGIIFNFLYVLNVEISEPEKRTPGVIYCEDMTVIMERIANIAAQNYLYKYKRRWLLYYRELLSDCSSLFESGARYEELHECGNYRTIEVALYDAIVLRNAELVRELGILKHIDRYPKSSREIYEWWSGRSKDQMQKIYNTLDDCMGMDKKSTVMPFILTYKDAAKDRIYYELLNMLHMFAHINPELSNAINFILRIYPDVFEQVYFPDRERYLSSASVAEDVSCSDALDNIRDKNKLRKCENKRCQLKNGGRNVVWNLNTFEVGKHSMNTVIKELCKNPRIFDEIYNYANKNLNIALNAGYIVKRSKQK